MDALQQMVATLRSLHSAAHQRVQEIEDLKFTMTTKLVALSDAIFEIGKLIEQLPVQESTQVIPMPDYEFIDQFVNDNYYDVVKTIESDGIERNWDLSEGWGDDATITCSVEIDGGVVEEQICNLIKKCVEDWVIEFKAQQIEKGESDEIS